MSAIQKLRTHVGTGKLSIFLLGLVILGMGCFAHFNSDWTSKKVSGVTVKPHESCNGDYAPPKCPKIAMEQYYIAMIIICAILSLASLAATIMMDTPSKMIKTMDAAYHIIAAVLLLIGAILFIVSAVQIKDLGIEDGEISIPGLPRISIKVRYYEKIAAGALTLIQVILYAVTGFLIFRN